MTRDTVFNPEYAEMKNVSDTSFEEGMMSEKKKIAITLKNKKLSMDFIMEVTGLSKREIEKL